MTWSLEGRSLYLCTPLREDLVEFITACVSGGVDVVQLREKDRGDADVLLAARELAAVCRDLGVPFVLNDRPDLAIAAGADGVHVGQDDTSVATCRRLLGPDAIVGLSTHATRELDVALAEPVSYLSAGPVVATPTKPGRAGTGEAYVAEAVRRASVPVFVTGGVTPAGVHGLAARGVRHFVVVRYLTEARDPAAAARALAEAIREATTAA